MIGVINVFKPPALTSFDVVARIRRLVNVKSVGHTGTLDPQAVGVLPVCLERATKLFDLISGEDKEYVVEMTLGGQTDTLDAAGVLVGRREVNVGETELLEVLPKFIGKIKQTPPQYSAIKIAGQAAYEYARKGDAVNIPMRITHIQSIDYMGQGAGPYCYRLRIVCSKGTYVRTLVNDIGELLGCGAYVSALLRSRSGRFTMNDAVTLERLEDAVREGNVEQCVMSLDRVLEDLPKAVIDPWDTFKVSHGNLIRDHEILNRSELTGKEEYVRVYDNRSLLALAKWVNRGGGPIILQPRIMLVEPKASTAKEMS